MECGSPPHFTDGGMEASEAAHKAGTRPGLEPGALGCSCCILSASPLTSVLFLSLYPHLGPISILCSPVSASSSTSLLSSIHPDLMTSRTLSPSLPSPCPPSHPLFVQEPSVFCGPGQEPTGQPDWNSPKAILSLVGDREAKTIGGDARRSFQRRRHLN